MEQTAQKEYRVFLDGRDTGAIAARDNPFHGRSCYLGLRLSRYDRSFSRALFEAVGARFRRPLQVMLSSRAREQAAFLEAGGFVLRRRCYEAEVSPEQWKARPPVQCRPIPAETEEAYHACCRLMYDYYQKTHEAVSPLTADFSSFRSALPKEALFVPGENGTLLHAAFLEGNEIAYVASAAPADFMDFAAAVAERQLERYKTVRFESDDCDPAAMALRGLFVLEDSSSWDTYIWSI